MIDVRTSIQPVVRSATHVRLNKQAAKNFVTTIQPEDLVHAEFTTDTLPSFQSEQEYVMFVLIYSAINFCYWGEPKWATSVQGDVLDGSAALFRALIQAITNGVPLLQPSYLLQLPVKDFETVLRGNIQIPLFHERHQLLRDLGRVVQEKYNGNVLHILEKAEYQAPLLVKILVDDIPEVFNDVSEYRGERVAFYKRAQLVPMFLHDLHVLGALRKDIEHLEALTGFADYKVPQFLRKFGILEYASELASKIDEKTEIVRGSEEEVEIRALSIWAIEYMTKLLRPTYSEITAIKVDNIFWFRGQKKSADDKPYHRTRTIWY